MNNELYNSLREKLLYQENLDLEWAEFEKEVVE